MLSELACRQAKQKSKAYRLFDSGGLYLDVLPTSKKVWRFKYRFHRKEKLLTIGSYPGISIKSAREKRDNAKELIEQGIDPAAEKQENKRLARFKTAQTIELVATEWHKQYLDTWTNDYGQQILNRLKANLFPSLGNIPIAKLTAPQLLSCIQKIEDRGRHDLARRVLQTTGQILRYAVVTGRTERDITPDLKGALKKYKKGHHAAIDSGELPDLLRAVDQNDARLFKQTILAIRLMLLTFVRTQELIKATWDEFDFKNSMWTIPAERMKMRQQHLVPLSRQTVKILNELKEEFGDKGYVFPSVVRRNKHISNNTILKALERLGYHKKMTGHGFRALAMSTIKEELGYRHEVVDRQLAHQPKNKVDRAYDRAQFVPERIKMMQKWADYIDLLRKPKIAKNLNEKRKRKQALQ